ncbi:Protein of unknown function [Pyronema omphalodes CBS 100304]|uniref:Uncharacterized protein n=1 Tax=Pyronema omphalodes (strain CBS 100304) TaxID=1076935 RepID=U4LY33_PYROM|nr:Protein of unknown function [Pyronema omphalodes CBS 100304]
MMIQVLTPSESVRSALLLPYLVLEDLSTTIWSFRRAF